MATSVVVRGVCVAASVWVGFVLMIDRWRAAEAAAVVTGFRAVGVRAASRIGDQIVVHRSNGRMFLADIEPLCSSLGIVLLFGALATFAVCGSRRRRFSAVLRGSVVVVVCNLVRIAATVAVGLWKGPGTLEIFHDRYATAFAVVFVLAGLAVFAFSLPVNGSPLRLPRGRPLHDRL